MGLMPLGFTRNINNSYLLAPFLKPQCCANAVLQKLIQMCRTSQRLLVRIRSASCPLLELRCLKQSSKPGIDYVGSEL